ncbi:hypothetical protein BT96DRAFT_951067 [Gymnopus androsaceus JB14]|uniref:Uncharacterized protein n=1 Tax=Gymnopus androsaceus JB14 TaxID=1447944 RepID=A0A6A4GEF6_9AGAR|nr:hypothetical protein BT96DRAFT_951067 [Gymnopus androsaceus JB14]
MGIENAARIKKTLTLQEGSWSLYQSNLQLLPSVMHIQNCTLSGRDAELELKVAELDAPEYQNRELKYIAEPSFPILHNSTLPLTCAVHVPVAIEQLAHLLQLIERANNEEIIVLGTIVATGLDVERLVHENAASSSGAKERIDLHKDVQRDIELASWNDEGKWNIGIGIRRNYEMIADTLDSPVKQATTKQKKSLLQRGPILSGRDMICSSSYNAVRRDRYIIE